MIDTIRDSDRDPTTQEPANRDSAGVEGGPEQVLVVDGDQISRLMLRHTLAGLEYATGEAYDVASAVAALSTAEYTAVVSDFRLPDGTGLDIFDAIRGLPDPPRFVLITDLSEWDDETDLRMREVPVCLSKPVSTAELQNSLETLVGGRS